jgi:chromosome segregation protein
LFLRSLTIKGFKSFARKTVLEFEPGVTIIVGPNGSGKSNIADAVMWVLGEQSPTSLRGNRMEDVIFSGSNSLKPVNLAEVSLVLDNSNNDFALDYSEVIVTRNVVRGGDSEYRLNNSACRLLDIQELLSDAGVGRTLNSVISQGQLDDVLSCRPEERRDYIEEAGGLLKYRKRREKAMRRLARMEEELVRTNDVAREVRRLLRPLQRQAGRLEQYTGLVRELREMRLRLDVARLRAMRAEWDEHETRQHEREKRLESMDLFLAGKAAEASRLEGEQATWRARETVTRNGLYRFVSLHEQAKAMLSLYDEKIRRSLGESAGGPAADPAELERVNSENEAYARERAGLLEKQEAQHAREAELLSRVAGLNDRLNDLARRRASIEARMEVLEASGLHDGAGEERLKAKTGELDRLSRESEEQAIALGPLQETAAGMRKALQDAEARLEAVQADRARGLEELRRCESDRAGAAATLDILSRLDTETWGPVNTSAALLKDDPTGGGLGSMLSGSIKIEPEHETAVNSFLGPWLCGIIARDTVSIVVAIDYLKENGLGQGLFFRHDGEAAAEGGPRKAIEGAVPARDSVTSPEWFTDALDALLQDVYIARDLASAMELAEKHPLLVFLSPDGDMITGGTLVRGGSPSVNPVTQQMSVDRRRKLEASLAAARENIEKLELEQVELAGRVDEARRKLAEAREGLMSARDALEARRSQGAVRDALIETLRKDLETVAGREEQSYPDPGALGDDIARLKEEEAVTAGELEQAEGEKKALAEELRASAARLASIERHLEIGRIKERDMRARKGARAGEGAQPIAEEELAMLTALNERLAGQLEAARERTRRALDEGVRKEKEAAEGLQELREEVAQRQGEHEELRDRIHQEELSRAELKVRVEQLVERIVDEHKVPLEFALKHHEEEEPTAELEAEVAELALRLEHIGPVNPEAITEREALEERHDFLKSQTDDIEKARTQLKRVARQIDREIEQKFTATLEQVNSHFKEIFSRLFPNGSAELRLTDPEDLLGSGVEIMAQPEGKRLRRISLLSGGETSMTAIAFFFALFKVRPSPFYFLDEVEAALDDVNLHRFLDLVKEFKGESQLVLITHQKRSMEIADLLYGVTMQEDGMSRVVSQRLTEEAAS